MTLKQREARQKCFAHGVIAPWYLREDQYPVYAFFQQHRFPVFEASRRYGKTTIELNHALEVLKKNPGFIWRWCEPNKNQAREIIMPEIEKIQSSARRGDRFTFHKTDSFYENSGGSKLFLRGVNEDADSARGTFANGITADEAGTWRDPEYVIKEVLLPQLLTTGGPLHLLSTPPEDLGHAWYRYKAEAIRENRFVQRLITDNASLSEKDRAEMCEAVGGPQSPAWLREFLCQPVSDPERLVIPEFKEDVHVYDSVTKPPYYDPYVGADLGFNDNSALLFGYHDFSSGILYIEAEVVVSGKNSREITDLAKQTEHKLWGQKSVYLRVSDNEIQQLHDMATLCQYQMVPTRKDDKLAAINSLRLRFTQGKIKINKRCKNLLFQLKVGLWNPQRTGFLRGENTGHLDAIDALIYLNRNINTTHNPFPAAQYDQRHFVNPHFDNTRSVEEDTLRGLIPEVSLNVF